MRTKLASVAACMVLLLAALPVLAHHSFDKDFNGDKTALVQGKITQVVWKNPHVDVYIDARDPDGTTATWMVEMGSQSDLKATGWKKDFLKVGDQIVADGWAARDGGRRVNAKMITVVSTGRTLDAASSFYGQHTPISN